MDVLALDPVTDPRWQKLVARSPQGGPFHHPAWLRLVSDAYAYPVTACCVAGEDGTLLAGLPVAEVASRITGRRLVALPFSDACPPLVRDAAAGRALAGALDALHARTGAPLEVRGGDGVLDGAAEGERFHHHLLALEPDVAAVERRFAKSQVRRGVRRARREGLQAAVRTDRAALEAFYALHVATRHRLGVPTQPRRFVLAFEEAFRAGLGFVLLVTVGHYAVAAGVFLTANDVLVYKYGASDERALWARPNNLLFMEAIRWGCEHGMRTLDFGRTGWQHESLRAFKRSWGAEERELRYRYVGGRAPGGRGGTERLLGPIIRHTPPVTGRAIGELLYRHAG